MTPTGNSAASISTLMRNSITSSTPVIELSPAGSMRNGRRRMSPATEAPAPCRYRLAHHGAADAEEADHFLLRRQPLAGHELAGGDLLGEPRNEFLGQVLGRGDGSEDGAVVVHAQKPITMAQ